MTSTENEAQGTAIVIGAGPGLGLALVNRFAAAGMKVAMSSRSADRLNQLRPTAFGDRVQAVPCDATNAQDVALLFDQVAETMGQPDLVVFNAGTFRTGGILDITPADFEECWRILCYGGFLVGQTAARVMLQRGRGGTVLFSGATASMRGAAGFANLAVPKFGLRALAQSMAREFGSKGIHIAHIVIDGQIGGGDTQIPPEAIAEAYYQLHMQPRGSWTHELDLRPWIERF